MGTFPMVVATDPRKVQRHVEASSLVIWSNVQGCRETLSLSELSI